jgi:hypothetical protein
MLGIGAVILGLLLLPTSILAADRRVDVDPAGDFVSIHSYAWMTRPIEVPDVERRAPLLDRILNEVVAEEMVSKTVAVAAEGRADLLFIYYLDPRENLRSYDQPYVTADMSSWLRPLKTYKESLSVVVIDGISGRDGRLLWRGIFAMTLDEPWKLAKKIRQTTAGLMRSIPIPKR